MAGSEDSVTPIAVSRKSAAVMLDCTRQHIEQLEQRGVLRTVRVRGSRAVRIPVEDVYAAVGLATPTSGGAR